MISGTARSAASVVSLWLAVTLTGCASFTEVAIETPLESKLDVGAFRRILIAGFATEPGEHPVAIVPETVRLLENQLRSNTRLRVIQADRPPLTDAIEQATSEMGAPELLTGDEREQYRLAADRVLNDAEFWRHIGEEYQSPLIVTGKIGFEQQQRSGFQAQERVVQDASGRPQLVRGNRYLERKGFALSADFHFVDGRTGEVLHKEKFTEEVLYGIDQRVSPLSSYFELMDRLLPNFLGVISPQKIRGTRILLK
jgi:hypothetical protein